MRDIERELLIKSIKDKIKIRRYYEREISEIFTTDLFQPQVVTRQYPVVEQTS